MSSVSITKSHFYFFVGSSKDKDKNRLRPRKRRGKNSGQSSPGDQKCPICRRRFKSIYTLKPHVQSHEHKFVCETCSSFFKTKQKMLLHVQSQHTAMRFLCHRCEPGERGMDHLFKRGDSLRDHTRSIHKKKNLRLSSKSKKTTRNLKNSSMQRVSEDCTDLLKKNGAYTFLKKAEGSDEDGHPELISIAKKRRRKFARSI